MQGAGTCDVPYCIVKSKARLGKLVNQKPVTAFAFIVVEKADEGEHF
jgi:ribosomal protein L7Ae-like RNA K-turn-binding protein